MELAEGIKKIGFRLRYERQSIESHAYLITGLLSSFLVLGSIESLSSRARGRAMRRRMKVPDPPGQRSECAAASAVTSGRSSDASPRWRGSAPALACKADGLLSCRACR